MFILFNKTNTKVFFFFNVINIEKYTTYLFSLKLIRYSKNILKTKLFDILEVPN